MSERILERLRQGDVTALAEVARQHGPSLLRFLQRQVPNGVDAEDLVHETFLVLLRNARRLEPLKASPATSAASRVAWRSAARKSVRRRELLDRRPEPLASSESRDPALEAAIAALPADLQAVIDAYFTRDVTYEQAAELLGITRTTFQSRLRRALSELRQALAPIHEERPS